MSAVVKVGGGVGLRMLCVYLKFSVCVFFTRER